MTLAKGQVPQVNNYDGFCRMVGGGGVNCGGHLEIHNDIHNADSCDVIEWSIYYAWSSR